MKHMIKFKDIMNIDENPLRSPQVRREPKVTRTRAFRGGIDSGLAPMTFNGNPLNSMIFGYIYLYFHEFQ